MARHHTTPLTVVSVMGAVLAGLGLLNLFSNLEWLTSLIPLGCQVLLGYAVAHHPLSPCPVQVLVDFWGLLHSIANLS